MNYALIGYPCFCLGVCLGFVACALFCANGRDSDKQPQDGDSTHYKNGGFRTRRDGSDEIPPQRRS